MSQDSHVADRLVVDRRTPQPANVDNAGPTAPISVTLLTGGGDRPYLYGLATELYSKGATLDIIGSDHLESEEFRNKPRLNFLNLRGDQTSTAGAAAKVARIMKYYFRLIAYSLSAKPKIFHILWNNKFEVFDRTLLMQFYRLLGKKIVLTLHNINAGIRDHRDSAINRATLRIQYHLADHLFVHTEKMKLELIRDFGVQDASITIIPFGLNNSVPNTALTSLDAKRKLGIPREMRTILFFGNITPYKGIEYLVAGFKTVLENHPNCFLIIAGRPVNCEEYWAELQAALKDNVLAGRIIVHAGFVPDEETEVYFKAADVLVLPYKHVYQSGVMFLSYSFGLPVLASDVGSLKEEIVEGRSGFVFRPEDPADLAKALERYFASDLFLELETRRQGIKDFAAEQHSWDTVGQLTMSVYASLQDQK